MGSEGEMVRKPRFVCLHGFRTSGEIMKRQVVGKWPESVVEKLDLVFLDGPFPAQGKSDVEGETDFLKPYGLELIKECVDPLVIHHPKGHTVPRLDEKGLQTMQSYLEKIQEKLSKKEE
ncbi:Serine hydrolase FSH [Trema orientale]|uniref:Serine hydrolase FSH n=1 Tax=Trema orientale TaxID=63057 RepID=A0A2P5DB56_TREOI|nr:Serine hydrolase FSH [Trema orientale]